MKPALKNSQFLYRAALWILAVALFGSAAIAQTAGAGTISGTLTDPAGSVVPDAVVVVRNVDTGRDVPLTTNGAGIYVAQFLQPGRYQVTATKTGFAKVIRENLTVQVGQTVTVDLRMPLQTTTESVTVTAAQSLVDPDKTDVSQVVSQTQKDFLPNAGRRWENFALMTPNVTTDGGSGLVSYRGISGLYNQSSVDGTSNTQAFFSETKGRTTLSYVYSMDSLQEFQVASSNYSAELGQAAGGIVNAVTKSGTNALRGDLFYYLRYPTLNALDPIQKAKGVFTQPVHQQQQFGGSVGGPIVKDKLFYFLTYDGSRRVVPIVYTSTSYNGRQACPAAISIAQCTLANNFIAAQLGAFPRMFNQDVGFGKLDYQLTAANRLSASFDLLNYHSPNAYRTNNTQNNESISANGAAVTRERIFVANWDSIIRPTIINNLRFQWSVDLEKIAENGTAPSVTIQNFMNYGLPNALPRPAFPNEHRLQFADVVSMTHGKHTFKAGFDFSAIHEVLINLFSGGGVYAYNGTSAFQNWAADVMGINLGDGLTGRHFSTFLQVTDPVTGVGRDDFYDKDFAGFFEDTWKIRSNLTLNLGVRYDLTLIPQPSKPNTLTPLTTLYSSKINTDSNNSAPRIGLAWELRQGTVLRAGYGIFYAKTSNSTYYATRVENGVIQQSFNCSSPTICPALRFPNVIFTPPGGTPTAPFAGALVPQIVPFVPPAGTQTTRGQSPDWVNPLVHEGEVTLEHQLPGNMSISAGYVVSRALRLPIFVDSNIAGSTTTRSYDVLNASNGTASTFTVPFYTTRLNPTTGPILTGYSDVNSWYNSLVITFRKRMERGVEFVGNYTLSKAVDGGQVGGQFGTFNGTDSPIDPYNRKLEYGLSDLDQRQRFVGNVIWIPQFTRKISNRPARLIVDGFNFSTIVTVATGQPVTGVIGTSNFGGIAGGPTGATVNNSGTGFGGRLPNLPRNADLGPGVGNVDLRVSRDFKVTERIRLSLAGEAFNVFNFTNFFTVNTTSYNLTAAGSGVCAGHANGCLVLFAPYLTPTASNSGLFGARQLQISGRFSF